MVSTGLLWKEERPTGLYKGLMGIASVGCAETLYLTMSKFLHVPLICLTSGCDSVVNSAYSEIYGVPVSLLGFFGYFSVGLFAWECLAPKPVGISKFLLMSATSLMASCSGVLLYTLSTKLNGEFCSWCYLSAALSFSLFGLSFMTVRQEEKMYVLMPSGGMAFIAAFALFTVFNTIEDPAVANDIVIDYSVPIVTTESDANQVSLAKRLKAAGVRMFGAFWCDHCYDQKQIFGKQAMEFFPYVECFPNGYRKGIKLAKMCEDANVPGYPTWIFGTKQIAGEQSIETLEEELTELQNGGTTMIGSHLMFPEPQPNPNLNRGIVPTAVLVQHTHAEERYPAMGCDGCKDACSVG